MGAKAEVVKAWTDAGDAAAASTYMAEDFKALDNDGNVMMDKSGWVGMGRLMEAAFDDLVFVRTDLREEADKVIMSGHFEGRHTRDLDLSPMGLGVFPASGQKIVWPDSSSRITVNDGKIARSRDIGEAGGLEAFLGALGGGSPVA